MIKNLTLIILLLTPVTKIFCQADGLSPHSVSIGWEGYIYTGCPWFGGAGQFAVKYSYSMLNGDTQASIGLGSLGYDHDNVRAITFPVEIRLGRGAFKLGLGGIFNTNSNLFDFDKSVFIPSINLALHPRFRKKSTFFCFDLRFLLTRQYEGISHPLKPPFARKGTSVSPGIGLSMGFGVNQN